ncbi:MAG: hydroxyacid dehydrogenase [Armatimonadetes bacterium]|nr:hydroxyacid dehydrogenase [Armatimonadota bacterium]
MRSVIAVHPNFDRSWPFAADRFREIWESQGGVDFYRLDPEDKRPLCRVVPDPGTVDRLVSLGVPFTPDCREAFSGLKEAAFSGGIGAEEKEALKARGVRLYSHSTEGFWGESVAEFGLALTLCALRRIPQTYHAMLSSHEPWDYDPPGDIGRPGTRGHQFGDDSRFTHGTLQGKRVRIVGVGNIGSRYASFCHFMGADVAAWDPFACEPAFHRSGARRVWHLDALVEDAEIFAPMLPLTDSTRGTVTADQIHALPKGCLVVLVTRAGICDMTAVRERVLADELSLAADVFDIEPLPLNDPLLGRPNVVHTPHNAGRTRDANHSWTQMLADQFLPGSRV